MAAAIAQATAAAAMLMLILAGSASPGWAEADALPATEGVASPEKGALHHERAFAEVQALLAEAAQASLEALRQGDLEGAVGGFGPQLRDPFAQAFRISLFNSAMLP